MLDLNITTLNREEALKILDRLALMPSQDGQRQALDDLHLLIRFQA